MIKNILITSVIAALFLIGGCCSTDYCPQQSELDKNWGRSFESAKYNQIIDPVPGNNNPVVGLDGQAAVNIVEGYKNSFKAESQPTQPQSSSILGTIMK